MAQIVNDSTASNIYYLGRSQKHVPFLMKGGSIKKWSTANRIARIGLNPSVMKTCVPTLKTIMSNLKWG